MLGFSLSCISVLQSSSNLGSSPTPPISHAPHPLGATYVSQLWAPPMCPNSGCHLCVPTLGATYVSQLWVPPMCPYSGCHLCVPTLGATYPKRKFARGNSCAKSLKRKIPFESSQIKFLGELLEGNVPKRKFLSHRSQTEDPKRKTPGERGHTKNTIQGYQRIIVRFVQV